MRYPKIYSPDPEPEEIRGGDLVWWNEGVCVGFVENLIEDEGDRSDYGLDQPGIAFTNLHPFEANQFTNGGSTVYPEGMLEDEGVGLLSQHERSELNWAIATAREAVAPEHRDLPFCVTAVMNLDCKEEEWVFHFVDRDCKTIASVAFPFRPKTRNKAGEQAAS